MWDVGEERLGEKGDGWKRVWDGCCFFFCRLGGEEEGSLLSILYDISSSWFELFVLFLWEGGGRFYGVA